MVYIIKAMGVDPPLWKIGKADNPVLRLSALQIGSPVHLELIGVLTDVSEKDIHQILGSSRVHGEWFHWTPDLQRLISNASSPLVENLRRGNLASISKPCFCCGSCAVVAIGVLPYCRECALEKLVGEISLSPARLHSSGRGSPLEAHDIGPSGENAVKALEECYM